MKKIFILIVFVLVMVLSSCSHHKDDSLDTNTEKNKLIFEGENDNWEANFKIDVSEEILKKKGELKYNSYHKKTLTVKYKGDINDLSSIKNMVIQYKSSVGKGTLDEDFIDNPINEKVFTITSKGNGAVESKDEIIEVYIILDGNKQTIKLKIK